MTEHLYTPKDVQRTRERILKEQNFIDPILLEKIELKSSVLDHSHVTQKVRAVLHRQSNAFEGKVFNAYIRCLKWLSDKPLPEILRNLADYYEDNERIEHTKPYHPGFLKRLQTDFNSLPESSKRAVLASLNQPEGGNGTERKKLFQKALKTKQFTFEQVKALIEKEKQ